MDYTCWGFSELIRELEARDGQLMGFEHEIAKSLAGLGESHKDLLRYMLVEIREKIAEISIDV